MNINQWFAFWRAHPSAPETRELALLRWQFNLAAFTTVFFMTRIGYVWKLHQVVVVFVLPLFLFGLLSGRRYLRLKRAADAAYIDELVATATRKADEETNG